MLAVTLSIDDFAVTVFTIGNEGLETLSTYIYADARKGGLTPELRPLFNHYIYTGIGAAHYNQPPFEQEKRGIRR